jgi:S1-C subfamily serine protease
LKHSLLLALLCLGLLAGCGSGDERSSSPNGTAARVATSDEPEVIVQASSPGFDASGVYRRASPGVVTIRSVFGSNAAEGSGFVLNAEGEIITNAHVVTDESSGDREAAEQVYVEFPDRNVVPAEIVGFDPFVDVALLQIAPRGLDLHPLRLGDDRALRVGQPVAAIGSPFGEQGSLSIGVVSAKNRTIEALTDFSISDAIQTDAAVNRGNSGGPLLDAQGRVIGINSQIRSAGGGSVGVGFAISIDNVRRSIDQIRSGGKASYAYIGISSQNLYPQLAKKLNVPVEEGALIADVVKDGPADRAGIKGGGREIRFQASLVKLGGDVITKVNGRRVTRENDFSEQITRFEPGDTISLELYRGNERRTARVTLGERPDQVPKQ